MIKDTSTKNKSPQNRLQGVKNGGFIRLFILIIIVVLLLVYFGLDPKGVWENLIKPVVEWGFTLIVKLIGFLFDIAIWFIDKLRDTINI